MREIYRIGVCDRTIHVERWPSWEAFDALWPAPSVFPCDLAYAEGEICFGETSGAGFELQRLRVNNGAGAAAKQLVEQDLAVWEAAGAKVIGRFEVVHGHDLPALLVILNWNSLERAFRAEREIESNTECRERRQQDRLASGRIAIRASSRILGCSLALE